MTIFIPSYDFWWTVSAIFGALGVLGLLTLCVCAFIVLRREQARIMCVVVAEGWAAVKARFDK